MNMYNTSIFDRSESQLNSFLKKKISNYSRYRNFDFGSSDSNYVSKLSPFISHRIILEYELVSKVLENYKYSEVEKFIQEVFWRIYWKGWLEHRPSVWFDYVKSANRNDNFKDLIKAYNGETKIECFNEWVRELKTKNYLHNHVRMWFASIWIFTFNLPWQMGANFFLKHLFDGDAASNTLSWRWVAGLQTRGKHYLARSMNIKRYTNNRFANIELNENALPKEESTFYSIENNLLTSNFEPKNENLLVFENDLHVTSRKILFQNYKKIYVLLLSNSNRRIELSEKVINYKSELLNDFKKEFKNNIISVNASNFQELINDIIEIDIIYPFIGENLDFILNFKNEIKQKKFNFIFRKEDIFCFKFAKKGFFNFKKNIPKIIEEFEL